MLTKSRITFKLPVNIHLLVQSVAQENHTTLTKWMISALLEKLIRDGEVKIEALDDDLSFRG